MKKLKKIAVTAAVVSAFGVSSLTPAVVNITNNIVYAETMAELGIDTSALEAAIAAVDTARANQALYTPESFAAFEAALVNNGLIADSYTLAIQNLAANDWDPLQPHLAAGTAESFVDVLNYCLGLLVLAPTTTPSTGTSTSSTGTATSASTSTSTSTTAASSSTSVAGTVTSTEEKVAATAKSDDDSSTSTSASRSTTKATTTTPVRKTRAEAHKSSFPLASILVAGVGLALVLIRRKFFSAK